MIMRRLMLPALVLALAGCWGSTTAESTTPVAASVQAPSELQRALERDLAEVEKKLLASRDEALLDRRLVIVAALSALDRAEPGEPPTTWSKDELLAAMKAQLERMGRDQFRAQLETRRKPRTRRKTKGAHNTPARDRFGELYGLDEEDDDDEKTEPDEAPGAGEVFRADKKDELARTGGEGERPPPPPNDAVQRQAAMVQTGRGQLSAEARAAIRRQLPRVQQCVPTRSVRTQVRVRAQLHQGRLRAPAVSADPPVAGAVSGCIVEALGAIEVPVDPDAPSRVVAFPFVVEAR